MSPDWKSRIVRAFYLLKKSKICGTAGVSNWNIRWSHTYSSFMRSLIWTHARYRFKLHNKIELTNFVTIIKMMCSIWVNDVLFDLSSIIEYHGNNIFNITTINSISSFNTVNWALSSIRLFVILCLRHYLFWDLWVYSTIPRN